MSYEIVAIDHIQLAAPKGCEEDARKFFVELLGFEEVEKPAALMKRGGVWFKYGGCQIHIGVEEPFTPSKKAHPAFQISYISDLKDHLAASGVHFVEDDNLPGADRIYVEDPFGNRLEFLEWGKE